MTGKELYEQFKGDKSVKELLRTNSTIILLQAYAEKHNVPIKEVEDYVLNNY